MTLQSFVPAVCVPSAATLIAGGLSAHPAAQAIAAMVGGVGLIASAAVAIEAEADRMRELATSLFLTTLWSIALIAIVRLALS